MRYHSSKQPENLIVPYSNHMDPLNCQAKFEVIQPPCGLATRTAFYESIVLKKAKFKPLG